MRAVRVERYGGPELMRCAELAVPVPGAGDVLVKVAFAGINFMDVHTRQGKYAHSRSYPVRLPLTLGMEGAGIVEAVGADVTDLVPGDRVAWCISWGSYADFAVVPAWRSARVPDAIELSLAAAVIFQGSTAHYLVNDVGRLGPGTTCLVHAASGAVGQILVQLAKRKGAFVVATASSPEKLELVRDLGADAALRYEQGGFADAVRELTAGLGAEVVFDAIGAPTLRESLRSTRARGLVVSYGALGGAVRDLDPIELGEAGSLYLTRPRLADHLADADAVRLRSEAVFGALLDGSLSLSVAREYAVEEIEEAHRALEERRQLGKAVLRL